MSVPTYLRRGALSSANNDKLLNALPRIAEAVLSALQVGLLVKCGSMLLAVATAEQKAAHGRCVRIAAETDFVRMLLSAGGDANYSRNSFKPRDARSYRSMESGVCSTREEHLETKRFRWLETRLDVFAGCLHVLAPISRAVVRTFGAGAPRLSLTNNEMLSHAASP